MAGALTSNAGDRYHFVYVVRRMIDMLTPHNDLKLICLESIAEEPETIEFDDQEETFLGVDLTEYYGGNDANTSKKIRVVQVKYSPTHPNSTWTLNKLCKNWRNRSGSSVIRKLANAFDFFYQKLKNTTSHIIQICLYSNQQMNNNLLELLKQAQQMLNEQNDTQGSNILRNTEGELREILNKLHETTNLSWKRLSSFIQCLDLSCFGQPLISRIEDENYNLLSQYHSESEIYISRLFDFVQDHASIHRTQEIYKKDVLARLLLREIDFFP